MTGATSREHSDFPVPRLHGNASYGMRVSVPVPEGFNEDDVFLMMDELLTRLPVQAMDIVEFNHELDKDDITAGFVSRLVEHVQGL